MARGTKTGNMDSKANRPGSGGRSSTSKEFQFVNVHFNAADQQYLRDNYEHAAVFVWEWYGDLPDGYKLSSALDKTSGRFNATLACSTPDDPNNGLILSARGATRTAALFGLAYADSIKFENLWANRNDSDEGMFG